MENILNVKGVKKTYNLNETVLKNINLEIKENTFTVILGQSGSGKSTLLNIMSGLLHPDFGSVIYDDKDIFSLSEKSLSLLRRNDISNIFQNYLLLDDLTVEENIKLGLSDKNSNLSYEEIIKTLGIEKLTSKFPPQLSGGQKQRVSIARAVIKKPKILFCDEATGALDEKNSKQVVSLLHQIKNKYNITIIFTTHNLKISKTADRIIKLSDGNIISDSINSDPISALSLNWGAIE